MPRWFEKTLKYNHGAKSLKAPFVIELDMECILKNVHSCQRNFGKSYTERAAMHEPSGWAMLTKCSFDETGNRLDYYRGIDKEMIPLTDQKNKSYKEQEVCHMCKTFCLDENDDNKQQ